MYTYEWVRGHYDIDLDTLETTLSESKKQEIIGLLYNLASSQDIAVENEYTVRNPEAENNIQINSLMLIQWFIWAHKHTIVSNLNQSRSKKLQNTISAQRLAQEVIQYINVKLDINLDEAFTEWIDAQYSNELRTKTANTFARILEDRVLPRNRRRIDVTHGEWGESHSLLQALQDTIFEHSIPTKMQKYLAKVLNTEKKVDTQKLLSSIHAIYWGVPKGDLDISQIPVDIFIRIVNIIDDPDRVTRVISYLVSTHPANYMEYISWYEYEYLSILEKIQPKYSYEMEQIMPYAHLLANRLHSVGEFLSVYNNNSKKIDWVLHAHMFGTWEYFNQWVSIFNHVYPSRINQILSQRKILEKDLDSMNIDEFIKKVNNPNFFFRRKYGLEE